MRFCCPHCQGLFELDELPARGLARCPSCAATVKVGAVAALLPKVPLPPDPDFRSLPVGQYQPQTLPAYLTQPPPRYEPPPRSEWDLPMDAPRGRSPAAVLMWVIGGWFAAILGLVVIVGVGFFAYWSLGPPLVEISVGDFVAKAPGRLARSEDSPSHASAGVVNPLTGSQFQLVLAPSGVPGKQVTAEMFVDRLATQARVTGRRPVTRAGLSGIHFHASGLPGTADMEAEAFAVDGGILVVKYQRGTDVAHYDAGRRTTTPSREVELDNPEAFFASLRRASQEHE